MPDFDRPDLGPLVKTWTIYTPEGKPWLYEARYLADGKKETRYFTYGRYSESEPARWECKQPSNPRPFFGLDALQARPAAQVVIHEAPKKAEAASVLLTGQVHLGMLGGVSATKYMDIEPLRGRRVVLLPDNDEPGRRAMGQLGVRLLELVAELRETDPTTQPDGKPSPDGWDIADAEGWTVEIAKEWAKSRTHPVTPERAQPASSEPAPASMDKPAIAKPALTVIEGGALRKVEPEIEPDVFPAFSEFALRKVFCDGHGQNWRHTSVWGMWAKWDGVRWVPDENKAITWAVQACCEAVVKAHHAEANSVQRNKAGSLKTVNAVIGLACSDPRIATAPREWDSDTMLLGTPTGIVDLRTGQTTASSREQLISKSTSVSPAPGAHPWWDKVLGRAAGADPDFLQLWCGYMLTGDTREERFLFIHGPGAAGKSKFLTPLSEIMGDYRRTAKIDSFTARDRAEHSEEIARLAGARLVTATETEEGSRWNESRITALTGRDAIAARHMHKSTFEFKPQFKLVFIGNHRPALRSVGEEMRRRIDLIEWGGTIPEAERILDLPDKLRAEYPAILAWMIEGCLRWQKQGLGKPQTVETATKDYLASEDTLGAWMDECVELRQGERTKTSSAYENFKRWADQAGEYVPSQKRFSQRLKDRGFATIKSLGVMHFEGLRLKVTDAEMRETVGWTPD
jgi:putative DNA primase/helicase